MPCESLRYTVVSGPMDVAMNGLPYAFEWFPGATVLNCKVERVIRDVDQSPSLFVLSRKSKQKRKLGEEPKLTTSPTRNVLEVSP